MAKGETVTNVRCVFSGSGSRKGKGEYERMKATNEHNIVFWILLLLWIGL